VFKAFQASSPQVEVDGRSVLANTDGILVGAVRRELFMSCGLHTMEPQGWSSQQQWLDVYRMINDNLGPDTLFSIGRRIPYHADFPADQMHDVPTALASINVAYHNAHRGGEIGHYKFVSRDTHHFEVHCDNPYPNEFDMGIIMSLVERFRGRNQYQVRIKSYPDNPLEDNSCVFEVLTV
jgi:hypothetical protein